MGVGNAEEGKEVRLGKTKRRLISISICSHRVQRSFLTLPIFSHRAPPAGSPRAQSPLCIQFIPALMWKSEQAGIFYVDHHVSQCFKCYAYLCHQNSCKGLSLMGQCCFNMLAPQYTSLAQRWQKLRQWNWERLNSYYLHPRQWRLQNIPMDWPEEFQCA